MVDVVTEALQACDNGDYVSVNIKKRLVIINNKVYDLNKLDEVMYHIGTLPIEQVISKAEELYRIYKYSIPSSEDNKRKKHFKAVPLEELTPQQMLYGENRKFAQTKLELWLLCNIMVGNLKWEYIADDNQWYWYSKQDSDFIILRNII